MKQYIVNEQVKVQFKSCQCGRIVDAPSAVCHKCKEQAYETRKRSSDAYWNPSRKDEAYRAKS